jgi:hypothetical protein
VKITVLLADAAQVDPSGKAHALGLGWTETGTPTPPMALLLLVEVEWHEANTPHHLVAELHTQDGQLVLVQGEEGAESVRFDADIEVGRPAGLPHGSPLNVAFAVNVGAGVPLEAGERYRWRVTTTAEPDDDFGVSFLVRADEEPTDFGPASIPRF